jgi:hypothetical protein
MAEVLNKCKGPKVFNGQSMVADAESTWLNIRHAQHLAVHTVSLADDSVPAVAGQTRAGFIRHELSNDGVKWVTYASLTVTTLLEINDMQDITTTGASFYRQRWEVGGLGLVGTLNTTAHQK